MARSRVARTPDVGPLTFARYAYPPNALGYCGPDDAASLVDHTTAGIVDDELDHLARAFEGAWPYLALIAGWAGAADPLSHAVVDAYWVGSPLLARIPPEVLAASLAERFAPRGASTMGALLHPVTQGAVAHHSLHVLAVYPWAGLLRAGHADPSLQVIESCLIRWGRVVSRTEQVAMVDVVTLSWDGTRLSLGPPATRPFTCAQRGKHLAQPAVGDLVAVHWDWVCEVLSPTRRDRLAAVTRRNLDATATRDPRVLARLHA